MAPITLTPGQFAKTTAGQRPGATYQAYRAYIAKRRPGGALYTAPTTPAAAPVDPFQQILSQWSVPNQAQIAKTAAQAVTDAISSSTAANKAAIEAQNAQLAGQSQRAQGFALALAQATAPNPGQIQGYYQEAADRLRGYGTGLTGAVAADQSAQTDATKAAVDQATGGLGQVTSYDPAALRNAAQMAGVVIPGSSLESQAANAATQAQYARAASSGNIENIAQNYIQRQNDLQAQVAAQNAALQAQRPTMLRQEIASETTQGRQDMATLLSALGLMNTQRNTTSLINTRKTTTKATTQGQAPGGGPTPTTWLNPVTGAYEKIPSGTTIQKVNGNLTPVPVNSHVVTKNGKDTIVSNKGSKGSGSGSTHMQSKTINGNTVLFDPATGNYYLPGDTKNPVNPNKLTPKGVDADKIRKGRAQATAAVTGTVKANPKILPRILYTNGLAKGIPGWALYQALKAEAVNHPDDPAWVDVLKPGWVAGRGR